MKTYTTTSIKEFNYTIENASVMPAGYGHKKITVTVSSECGETKEFTSITDSMLGFDNANDSEELFELVQSNLEDQIAEWLYELED